MLRKLLTVTLLGLAALGLFSAPAGAATVTVDMVDDNTFKPPEIAAKAGDIVIFRNAGAIPHTATLKGLFDSGSVAGGGQFQITTDPSYPPEFEVVCTFHQAQGMRANMKVEGGTGELEKEESPPPASPSPSPVPKNPAAAWWARTSKLPIGLRVFAPLALGLFLLLVALGGLAFVRALKKANES
jgi:plastocyanin